MTHRLETIIFAIDQGQDLHTRAKFLRHIDTARAMGTLRDGFQIAIGYWEGMLETSYIMSRRDYEKLVLPIGATRDQVCVLAVSGDTRQPCVLEYQDGSTEAVGIMKEVSPNEIHHHSAWTFVESTGKYFTTV